MLCLLTGNVCVQVEKETEVDLVTNDDYDDYGDDEDKEDEMEFEDDNE